MQKCPRTRRILKWTGAGLSVLVLVIWLASLKTVSVTVLSDFTFICIRSGSIRALTANYKLAMEYDTTRDLVTGIRALPPQLFSFGFRMPLIEYRQIPESALAPEMGSVNRLYPRHNYSLILIPFWILLLLTAMPTAWLWHRDRRRIRPGCCLRCGYDLTGNASGVCPECGNKVHPPAVLADSECGLKKAMANSERRIEG